MLQLTDQATSAIRDLVDTPELPASAGLRIAATDGEPRGLTVAAAPTPEEGDEVIENMGARVFLEPTVAPLLERQVLDASVSQEGKLRFQLASQ